MAGFNPNDMELTPGIITLFPYGSTAYPASAGYNLGATLSGIKIGIKTDKAHFMSDQTGSTPLDSAISGQQFTITTEISQTRDYILAASAIFPHCVLLGTTPGDGIAPSAALLWTNKVGQKDSTVSFALNIHPQDIAVGNPSYDMTFFKVAPTEVSELDFTPNKQSTWKIVYTIYPDFANPFTNGGNDYRFMMRGNTTLY